MASIAETAVWTPGVYQIEEDDDVLGGPEGPDNKPLRDLANRTGFLRLLFGTVVEVQI
jgi:hypothetical protein